MSLLLEALKKAEKAKEEAQRRARDPEGAVGAPSTAAAEPEPDATPVRTRDQLPDIRQPLEILSEEVAPKRAEPRAAPSLALAEDRPLREAPAPRARASGADPQAPEREAQRTAARKVFEAKFREPNPRLPFFITLGALGVFAVGTVIYFWIQLRPPSPLVNTNPQRPASEAPVAAAPPKPAATAPAGSQSAIPGLPAGPGAVAPPPEAAAPAKPQPVARAPETPLLKPAPRVSSPSPGPRADAPAAEISGSRPTPQVHPRVASGYAAYLAGDLAKARTDYQEALGEEPSNRDALLGLAAVDVRSGRYEAAEGAYQRLLQADPRDSHAQAALMALRSGRGDPLVAESRVKSMLADNPGSHMLNFTLGNQLAQQGRWAEAQQQYFKAFAAEPDNPDFAYNVAVSLDHLRQTKLALEYYRRAIALAKNRSASFDPSAAEIRALQLGP